MKRASRVDVNQREIIAAFRAAGATVKATHQLTGFVDLLVGYAGVDQQVEIKDGSKPPSARRLTEPEQHHWDTWRGRRPALVTSIDDVEPLMEAMRSGPTGS